MGWRFRKRLKLLPGIWVNLSKKGGSLSVGGHGLTTNISRQGVRETISAPGTGVSYQTRRARLGHSQKISDKHEHRGAIRRPTGRRFNPAISIAQALLGLAVLLVVLWLLAHHKRGSGSSMAFGTTLPLAGSISMAGAGDVASNPRSARSPLEYFDRSRRY